MRRFGRYVSGLAMIPFLGFVIMWGDHDRAEVMCAEIAYRLGWD